MCFVCVFVPKHSSTQLAETVRCFWARGVCKMYISSVHFPGWFCAVGISERGRSVVLCETEIKLFLWVRAERAPWHRNSRYRQASNTILRKKPPWIKVA